MSALFEDSDFEIEDEIKTDNIYAKNYNEWRQKEELNKLKTKYGELPNESGNSSSSSEGEDEEAVQITEDVEKDFLKTLASLKTKDPKIYDADVNFFIGTPNLTKSQKKDQPMYIKDYERKMLLENEGHIYDPDKETCESKSLTYVEEQEKSIQNLRDGLKCVNDDSDNELGGIAKSRKKTRTELKKEEEDYKQWLLGQTEHVNDEIKKDLQSLKDYWNNPKLDDNEKFLRDYILNKRFMELEDKNYIPKYEEIVHDSDQDLSEDEKQIAKQEEFEHKYNYRFEEPDEEFIKRYPRTIENSLRQRNKKRTLKRAEIKKRKHEEKMQKIDEIKQMQMLKKKEIEEKIKKLKEITGNPEIAFDDMDIDGDFDPETHDKKMQNLFNDNYYQDEEQQKPQFSEDEELEIENWEKCETGKNQEDDVIEPHCEDDDFNMDCDYTSVPNSSLNGSKEKKKRKKKSKFAEVVSELKPIFNPANNTYEQYLDEYYKLECEDIIGDIPCRFKYRKVMPNSFGLTIEEILLANDRELNKWCSLKKAVQYRPENVEKYDVIAFQKKGKNEVLKKRVLPSLFIEEGNNSSTNVGNNLVSKNEHSKEENQSIKNLKNKKKRKRNDVKNNIEGSEIKTVTDNIVAESSSKRKKNNMSEFPLSNIETVKDNLDDSQLYNCSSNTGNVSNITNKEESRKKNLLQKLNKKNQYNNNNNVNDFKIGSKHKSTFTNRNKKNLKTDIVKDEFKNKYPKGDKFDISDARLKAFGFKPKKFKNKLKYGQKTNINCK